MKRHGIKNSQELSLSHPQQTQQFDHSPVNQLLTSKAQKANSATALNEKN